MYTFKAVVGTFWIRTAPGGASWQLGIGDEILGKYGTPEAAAEQVQCRSTGYVPWDRRNTPSELPNLDEWKHDEM